MTAYGLSRYRFKGRQALEMYFLLGLMFPIQIAILPLFIIMRTLKLTNTFLGMIILYTANMSFSLFIFTQFFKELPAALHESAVIDGASSDYLLENNGADFKAGYLYSYDGQFCADLERLLPTAGIFS